MLFKKLPPAVYLLIFVTAGLALFITARMRGKPESSSLGAESLSDRRSLGQIAFSQTQTSPNLKRGNEQFKQKDYPRALESFQTAIADLPDNPIPRIYAQNARVIRQNHIKIAAVVPLGSNYNVALEMLRGIAMGQENASLNIMVEIFNDDNDPNIAKTVAHTIVTDPSIKAVIGHNASNATLQAAPIYEKAGIVMITPTSSDTAISEIGSHIYRTTPNIRNLIHTLVDYSLHQARRKKVAICYDAEAADNLSFKQEFINELLEKGGEHIDTDCNFASPQFDPQTMASKLISDGADAVVLTPHVDRLERLIDLSKANRWRMALLGSPSLETEKILDIAQGDLNGVVIPVPYHQDTPSAQPFVKQVQQTYGVIPTWRTFAAMDSMTALMHNGQTSDDRAVIQARLKAKDFQVEGSVEPIRFLPTGDRIGKGVLVQIRPQEKGYQFELLPQS